MSIRHRIAIALCLATFAGTTPCATPAADADATPRVRFAAEIAPLLERHCIRCHQPGNEKGDVSLATGDDLRELGHITAGEPQSSYLIELVAASAGERPQMPKEGEPLSAEEVALLARWIAEGAEWPGDVVVRQRSKADRSWWSLQPIAVVQPPDAAEAPPEWRVNAVDRFVWAKLAESGLAPNPPADRRTLIRRVTYDLTGLPPTPEEVAAFVADDSPDAYPQLIDRLLASPRYGERWGRHWLDVVRFGESRGFERNEIITNLWPFRDYVIRALNADQPFDQFIREHLAGDVLAPDQPEVEVAAAFLVAGPYDDVGNQDAVQGRQIRANTIDEMIQATCDAFLGLTVGCARCHDHKFDPILQTDYYQLYATFAGVRHGSRDVATREAKAAHTAALPPLHQRKGALTAERDALENAVVARAAERAAEYEARWPRDPVDRRGTEERFAPVEAKYVRLTSEGQDANPEARQFNIDEFEAWTVGAAPRNVALADNGARASGQGREIRDFPGAYGPQLAIDGRRGARFIATGGVLTVEFTAPAVIDRIVMASARGESNPEHSLFLFVSDYRLETSLDGETWNEVAHGRDRKPVNAQHRRKRLLALETSPEEIERLQQLRRELALVEKQIAAIPPLPSWWVGTRNAADAQGPFHIFIGGSPERPGAKVTPASLSAVADTLADGSPRAPADGKVRGLQYVLPADAPEADRRVALADWIIHPDHPLTPRVLANRVWHYHFGAGLVDTPSDFGWMGGRPTHPELLDWLARRLLAHGWRLKPLHRELLLSQTYRQASTFRQEAALVDGDARLLWRFPPRRLSAEEVRDTLLAVSGKLNLEMGGPGFKLYRYLQDNVSTYLPLDQHGPETYRRAVYHHNARSSPVDLMTDFDQPDCAFAAPRRAETTTPLQALTMLNHTFTLDMAAALAERIDREARSDPDAAIVRAYELCYERPPSLEEAAACRRVVDGSSLATLCRVLLNTSELVYVE